MLSLESRQAIKWALSTSTRDNAPYLAKTNYLSQIWNGPNSLLGLLGAIGGNWQHNRADGVAEVARGWFITLLRRFGWADAITLGDVILYSEAALIPLLHDHEMTHVHQGRVWGPFFLPVYVLESLYQWLRTGDGYHNNRFEVAAYRVEKG